MKKATLVSCSGFAKEMIKRMNLPQVNSESLGLKDKTRQKNLLYIR